MWCLSRNSLTKQNKLNSKYNRPFIWDIVQYFIAVICQQQNHPQLQNSIKNLENICMPAHAHTRVRSRKNKKEYERKECVQ